MIAPFTLRDLLLLKQMQKQHTSLCPVETLTRPQAPIWAALASLLPLDEARLFTFVLTERRRDEKCLLGFVQVEQPPTRPEMYIRHISPRLDNGDPHEDTRAVWNRLLNYVSATAGDRGLQRIYACAAEGGETLQALLGAGFSMYAREEIFCLGPDTHPQAVAQKGIRPEQSTDGWPLNQLYRDTVPHLVQQAEALTESKGIEAICGPIARENGEGFVLEDQTGIAGYGHLMPGRSGHWLTILVHPRAYNEAVKLLDYGLALLNYYPPYPIYCAVREYQGGIRTPLQERGFEAISLQCHTVKHTTVRVKETARTLVHALEKRAEARTPTASRTEYTQHP
jgi:hypothetical protein